MQKTIKLQPDTFVLLLQKKSEIVAKQEKDITFSEVIKRVLNKDA